MELNRETAMRLWGKFFGNSNKVEDFAGREIAKGAYNDRNSKYGWNVDHILPQSRGGKTADYNLICCHISTNDEKADKFPCFSANGVRFEIVKVENHYEIRPVEKTNKPKKAESLDKINFFDSASGVSFFKRLKSIQNKPRFVGSVFVRLNCISNTAVLDFIEKFFDDENISYEIEESFRSSETKIKAVNYNMPNKDDISKLLDKCILLNTYLGHYFLPKEYLTGYDIFFRVDAFAEKKRLYIEYPQIKETSIKSAFGGYAYIINDLWKYHNSLFINELVRINTEAEEKIKEEISSVTEYNYIYTQLSKNLDKEVSER